MQVFANIANVPERKIAQGSGKPYYTFRAAENGRGEKKEATWYDVKAFINEMDGDLLAKGQFVKITGTLKLEVWMKKDNSGPAGALIIMAGDGGVEPIARKPRTNDSAPANESGPPDHGGYDDQQYQ